MTEKEWLECKDTQRMLDGIIDRGTARKFRLFACACYRDVQSRLELSDGILKAVEIAEQHSDGLISHELLFNYYNTVSHPDDFAIVHHVATPNAFNAAIHACKSSEAVYAYLFPNIGPGASSVYKETIRLQAEIVRCIFDNPFRRIAFNPVWLTSTVKALAAEIYEQRAFERMPVLGDALEESGCDVKEVLEHCRNGGDHVRGCWVVDKVLGRE